MNTDGYESVECPNGSVIQSGMFSPSVRPERTIGFIVRGVVIATYYEDDPEWANRGWAKDSAKGVYCDVRTYGINGTRFLSRVPVLQRVQGLHDSDIYIPRASSQNIGGGDLNTEEGGTSSTRLTPANTLDGDHVLVSFLENDISQPVILPFELPHPGTQRKIESADGRTRTIQHQGALIRIDQNGSITIDATGCAEPNLGAGGKEISAAGTGGGEVTIKAIDGASSPLSIELATDGSITIRDSGAESISLDKPLGQVAINAQQNFQLIAPLVTITATGGITITGPTAIAGAVSIAGGLAVAPGPSGAISLGGGSPIVSHSAWATPWASLMSLLAAQIASYAVPPPTVSPAQYLALLTGLQAVATAFTATATLKTTAA